MKIKIAVMMMALLMFGGPCFAELLKKVTVEEAEKSNLSDGVPFGLSNKKWKTMVAGMQSGDELWYIGPKDSAEGLWGYAVVREGKVVDQIITLITD